MEMMSKPKKQFAPLVAAAVVFALASGCVVVSRDRHEGDIALAWGFEDATSCAMAGVDSVIVTINGEDVADGFERALPCAEGGARFTDFLEGAYTVQLEGRDARGVLYYAATRSLVVDGGRTTDLGIVTLRSTVQDNRTGSLMVDWSFLYPDTLPTLECATAGVEYVGIRVTDAWGYLMLDQSVRCVDGPAVFDYFDPGEYDIEITGLGAYRGQSVVLYGADIFRVSIYSGELTDTGIVALDRYENQFTDFLIGWSFGGNNSCASVGVNDVTVRIYRLRGEILEVEETVACTNEPLDYYTFVPGDYGVEIEALGPSPDQWYGYVEVSVSPGTLADVTVQTELYF